MQILPKKPYTYIIEDELAEIRFGKIYHISSKSINN